MKIALLDFSNTAMRIGASLGILANDLQASWPMTSDKHGLELSGYLPQARHKGCQHVFAQCVLEEQALIGVARQRPGC